MRKKVFLIALISSLILLFIPKEKSNSWGFFGHKRINRMADRVNHSIDQIDSIVADVNAGRGTLGRLVKDEQIYNDARAAIARFNTAAERIDNVVAAAQRGEGTVGKLLRDETLYSNVNQLSAESTKLLYDFRQNPKKYLTIKFQLF